MALDLSKIMKKLAETKSTPPPSQPEGIIESLNKIDEILAEAKAEENVHSANEPTPTKYLSYLICTCGHPSDTHDDGQECEILECECVQFVSVEPEVEVKPEPSGIIVTIPDSTPVEPVVIQAVQADLPEPNKDCMPDGFCAHLCECGNWWTHGQANKCRFPDLLKQGRCQSCLGNDGAPYDPLEGFNNNGEKVSLTPSAQVKIRNDEQLICKAMTVEQLTYHIEFIAKRIEELRTRAIHAREMRAELEKEELKNIPEEEREKFRQEMRNSAKKTAATRTPRVKKEKEENGGSGERLSKMEKTIRSLMKSLNKTRAQVEAMLND